MNIRGFIYTLLAGGEGSGCRGDNCGRPSHNIDKIATPGMKSVSTYFNLHYNGNVAGHDVFRRDKYVVSVSTGMDGKLTWTMGKDSGTKDFGKGEPELRRALYKVFGINPKTTVVH